MEDKIKLNIVDENGKDKEVEVVASFKLKSNNKDYIVYTENEEDNNGNVIIYTSEVVEKGGSFEFVNIEDKKIIEEVAEVLKSMANEK